MMKLHGCKKCQGTLILDKDEFGWYEECMQCGYSRDVPMDVPFAVDLTEAPIPVPIVADDQVVKEKWKLNKIPAYQPFRKGGVLEEDTY